MRATDGVDAVLVGDRVAEGWLVASAEWTESLNAPYRARIELEHDDRAADAMGLLGAAVELVLSRRGVEERLAGIATEVREGGARGDGGHATLIIEPALAALRHKRDTRIFQHLTVPQILEQVLGEDLGAFGRSIGNELSRAYPVRDYTVQYDETDFDFVHRLMEEEGIVYYFRHEGGAELMVLVDRFAQHPEIEGESASTLRYSDVWSDGADTLEAVRAFSPCGRITGTEVSVRTFDWTHPSMPVVSAAASPTEGPTLESYVVEGTVTMGGFGDTGFTENDAGTQAQLLRELQARDRHLADGLGTSLALRSGHRVTLSGLPRFERDGDYLAVRVEHRLRTFEGGSDEEVPDHVEYVNRFTLIGDGATWRPDRTRRRPRIGGVQTATVVGPAGEEIHTDPHGRVKVRFHWDRLAPGDDRSSCWIRVMQSMGGPGWGFTFVPRVGQEVVVTFVNGDPDQPLVTGAVFNGENPLALDFPANKTRMTIKSNSSPGGAGFNELRFEDKAGAEEIWLHGERDWNTLIKRDLTRRVGHDEAQEVVRHRTRRVGGDESVLVQQNLTRQVDMNETEVVHMNRTRTVDLVESIVIGVDRNKNVGQNENVEIGENANRSVGVDLVETIGQHVVQQVGQDVTRSIGNDESVQIGNDAALSVVANRSTAVGANESKQVGQNLSVTVGADHSATVKGNEQSTVRQNRVANVMLTDTLTVGIAHTVNVTGMQTVSVGQTQTTSVGGACNLNVTGAYTASIQGTHTGTVTGASAFQYDGGRTVKVKGDYAIEVSDGKFEVKCGDCTFTISADGAVTFDTTKPITLTTADTVEVVGEGGVGVNGRPGNVVVEGGVIKLN